MNQLPMFADFPAPAQLPMFGFRVTYDRPRGLTPLGYETLVKDERHPATLAHVKAMCAAWQVGASLVEDTAARAYVGRVEVSGTFNKSAGAAR